MYNSICLISAPVSIFQIYYIGFILTFIFGGIYAVRKYLGPEEDEYPFMAMITALSVGWFLSVPGYIILRLARKKS